MGRPQKSDPEIDVLPYMDSMVITLNMVCLIIIIMIVPILENTKQVNSLSFEKLSRNTLRTQELTPVYFDCRPDGVTVLPGDIHVSTEDLVRPGNRVEQEITRIMGQSDKEYIILLVRPYSLPVYRYLRKEIDRRDIVTGFDTIDSTVQLDWREESKKLRLRNVNL